MTRCSTQAIGEILGQKSLQTMKTRNGVALSTVTGRNIFSHYPDFDSDLLRWSLLFNQKIEPCPPGVLPSSATFKHNHYVPLICSAEARKRKSITSSLPKSKKSCSVQPKLSFLPSIRTGNVIKETPDTSMKTAISSIIVAESEQCNSLDNISSLITPLSNSAVSSVSKVAFPSVSSSTICTDHGNEYDVAFYRDKVKGIKNVFIPDELYTFPKTNGRSFHINWLCYSPSVDSGFCLPCVLFGDRFPGK